MKTLREYLDQLDEISRRDFLKTAGGAAAAAASSGAAAFNPLSSAFTTGALAANQRRELEMEIPELNIQVATLPSAPGAEELTDRDQETIIKLIHLYLLNNMPGGDSDYRSLAWETLNSLAAYWRIRALLRDRTAQIQQHYQNKQSNDPAYYQRLRRIYTTNQQIQNQVYDQARALVERGRQLATR